jgi:hypothetical protein
MFRRILPTAGALVALAFAATAAHAQTSPAADASARTPPPPASVTPVDVALWRTAYVNERGVVPVGASEKGMEYGVNGSFSITPQATVRGWMRWEEFAPTSVGGRDTRSFTQLIEADCQGGRGRMLAMDLYPYNNLQGEVRHIDNQDPQWSYARPGSVLEQNVALMCSTAKAALTAVLAEAGQPSNPTIGGSTSDLTALAVPK